MSECIECSDIIEDETDCACRVCVQQLKQKIIRLEHKLAELEGRGRP